MWRCRCADLVQGGADRSTRRRLPPAARHRRPPPGPRPASDVDGRDDGLAPREAERRGTRSTGARHAACTPSAPRNAGSTDLSRTSSASRPRPGLGKESGSSTWIVSATARPPSRVRTGTFRPPTVAFAADALATDTHSPPSPRWATSLNTMPACRMPRSGHDGRADPVESTGVAPQRRDGVFVEVVGHRDPRPGRTESIQLLPHLANERRQIAGVDAHRTELRPGDPYRELDGLLDVVACRRGASYQAPSDRPGRGTPPPRCHAGRGERVRGRAHRRHAPGATRLQVADVAPNPAMNAARAAATALCSPARREPISASGRPSAADTIRAAAEATAVS